jgi:hypothetical protein
VKILIACEFSGIVREAFRARGHEAWSCDLLPTEQPGSHHVGNVLDFIRNTPYLFDPLAPWDLLIAHPPCTYLTNAGVRWLYKNGKGTERDPARWSEMQKAADFFDALLNCNIPRIAVENPIPHRHAQLRQYSQVIQPWQFGHGETKATCLWLKNLPPLKPTKIVSGRTPRVHHASPGPLRWKERSRTLRGIAEAMAEQWSNCG